MYNKFATRVHQPQISLGPITQLDKARLQSQLGNGSTLMVNLVAGVEVPSMIGCLFDNVASFIPFTVSRFI